MTSTKQEEVILQTKHASRRKVEQESDLNGTNKIVEVKFNNQKIIINNRIIVKKRKVFLIMSIVFLVCIMLLSSYIINESSSCI